MKLMRLNAILLIAIGTLFVGCAGDVTNNVAGPTSSTPPTTQANSNSGDGGVINGGGGRGVLCRREGKETVEVLDLYEARTLYDLKLLDFGASEDVAKDKLAEVLARHLWNPYTIEMKEFAKSVRKKMIQEFLDQIRFIDAGKKLKLVNDAFDPTLEHGCEPVQIAMYYDESVLLVDKTLWEKLDWTNKVALLAHEALYFWARQAGAKNSMSVRKLVGLLFSEKGAKPMWEGVPVDTKKFIECDIESNGFSRGGFYMYASRDEQGRNGVEVSFRGLGDIQALFRTTAFFEDLSISMFGHPNFNGTRIAEVKRDTYPARELVQLKFRGTKGKSMTAEVSFLRPASKTVESNFNVTCQMPDNLASLEVIQTEPGRFEQQHGDGSTDRLEISATGALVYETTRHVGGPGGLSNKGNIPMGTSCRIKVTGVVVSQDEKQIEYRVTSAELGDLTGLTETQHCPAYIEALNQRASDGSLRYSLYKSDLKKIR